MISQRSARCGEQLKF